MKKEFIQLSNKVIRSADKNQYFAKVESKADFQKTFFKEEAQYEISARDVEIELRKENNSYTEAILLSFCKQEDASFLFVDVLISDLIGTFISDWY